MNELLLLLHSMAKLQSCLDAVVNLSVSQ